MQQVPLTPNMGATKVIIDQNMYSVPYRSSLSPVREKIQGFSLLACNVFPEEKKNNPNNPFFLDFIPCWASYVLDCVEHFEFCFSLQIWKFDIYWSSLVWRLRECPCAASVTSLSLCHCTNADDRKDFFFQFFPMLFIVGYLLFCLTLPSCRI